VRYWTISIGPDGRADPETGPDGPYYTLEEAWQHTHPPDPLSGWQVIMVAEVSQKEPKPHWVTQASGADYRGPTM